MKPLEQLQRHKGQGLAEYALIAFVVLVASIPLVNIVGSGVETALGQIFQGMNNSVIAQAQAGQVVNPDGTYGTPTTPSPTGTNQPTPTGSPSTPPPPGNPGDMTVTLKDGTVLALKNYLPDMKSTVETSGTNGATLEILAQLDSMIAQLQQQPNADPAQISRLQALANQGHKLAEIEAAIAKAYTEVGSLNDLANWTTTIQGQTYTGEQLTQVVGFWNPTGTMGDSPQDLSEPLNTQWAQGETATFINLYNDALASGALSDPAINAFVTDAASKISYLTEATEHGAIISPDEASLAANMASNMTDTHSGNICAAGGGSDSGVHCY